MAKSGPKRLGVLGGTFDPVHLGHLAVARAALDQLSLDEILFIPSFKPPHKQQLTLASYAHRLAMLKLALADEPQFSFSGVEGERQELSYTIDTLKELRHRLGHRVSLFFLMGVDAFVEMATWKSFRDIPTFADLVVINRPQAKLVPLATAVTELFAVQHRVNSDPQRCWRLVGGGAIHELIMDEVPISSSAIRTALAAGEEVIGLLHPAVARYISDHRLYRRGGLAG